jgi:hypothetical protein
MRRPERKKKCHKHSLATNLVSDKRGKEPETVIESYRRLVDLQHMTKDIATLTWKRKRRDCEVIGDLLSVPMGVVEDINGRGMTDLLERVATETREWAGKYSHSTVERNYHEGIKEALVFARGALGLNSEEAFNQSLSRTLLMIRREESPPKEPLECPTDDDVATVLRFADEVIAEQRPRPGLRMSRKTGEWERRMSLRHVRMARAAVILAMSTGGRTGEIHTLRKEDVTRSGVTRVVSKGRSPERVTTRIDPSLWGPIEEWKQCLPEGERFFPYGRGHFDNIISAFHRQSGVEWRRNGLYPYRRWSINTMIRLGADINTIRSVSMHQSNDSILAYVSELSERRSRDEGVGLLQGRLRSIYRGDDAHNDSLGTLSQLQADLCTLMESVGDGNSSAYNDEGGLVRFDFERMSRVKRRGGRLRHISVELAGDAGFEPTSPAPKAGRISRLP